MRPNPVPNLEEMEEGGGSGRAFRVCFLVMFGVKGFINLVTSVVAGLC